MSGALDPRGREGKGGITPASGRARPGFRFAPSGLHDPAIQAAKYAAPAQGRTAMLSRSTIDALALKVAPLAAALAMVAGTVAAGEEIKYPDWKGQWRGVLRTGKFGGQPSFDPTKPWGKGQQAPLTPEYQAILETNLKSQEQGGFFDWRGAICLGFGMPLIAYGFQPTEFIVTPETTYMLVDWVEHTRRIYTDGRDWPKEIEPTLVGYSIGKWIDDNNDGHYDVLEVETSGFQGPRH